MLERLTSPCTRRAKTHARDWRFGLLQVAGAVIILLTRFATQSDTPDETILALLYLTTFADRGSVRAPRSHAVRNITSA